MARVMIVDDDRTMVSLLRMLLEMEGYEVIQASQAEAILSGVREQKPDLILMDVFLPGVDGLDLLARIRSTPELARSRIVMTSGMELSDRCMAAGADAFLLKPYSPEQLISVIKTNLAPDGSRPSARPGERE